jgi:uncharacterized alpha-E superfamily protein
MLSRVADGLYWMARYLERAEHTARLIEVQLNLMLDQSAYSADQRWRRIVASLGDPKLTTDLRDAQSLTYALIFDRACRSSIVAAIVAARENSRQVRQQISSEMWEQLNRLFHQVRRADLEEGWDPQPHDFLLDVHEGCHLFQGITDGTMSHNEGWQFIQIGRHMERVMATAKLLDTHYLEFENDPHAHLEWIGLLRSCTAFEAYCKYYTADVRPDRVAEFLLLNDEFPHTIRFAVDHLEAALKALPDSDGRCIRVSRLAGRLKASLSFAQVDEIMSQGFNSYLRSIQQQCEQIDSAMRQAYIDYPVESALTA